MKTSIRIFLVLLLAFLALGNRGCTTTDTVILSEGPRVAALSKAKDEQIAGLTDQVKAEMAAREMEQVLASKAASSVVGMLKAREYLDPSLPSDAIKAEGDLALTRLPKDDPAETVKALERVVAIVTGQRDEALKKYAEADTATKMARDLITAKNAEISAREKELEAQRSSIIRLTQEAETERVKHRDDVNKLIKGHQDEVQKIRDEQASAERRWWVNASRIAGLALIVAGAVALAVFKLAGVGGGLVGAGVLVGLISIGVDILTKAWWFPWLCGLVFVVVIGLGCYGIYRLWLKHQLGEKKTQAIQDMIDETQIKGDTKTHDELKAHLNYRLGDSTTFWGKQQKAEVAALGLINSKAEQVPPPS